MSALPFRSAMTRAILLVVALCTCALAPCRSRSSNGVPLDVTADSDSIAPGVAVTAHIIPGREEINERFATFLPDSGIVPVDVVIRNDTERPIVIHTSHGLKAGEAFHGFTLSAGGEEYIPVEPIDVLALLLGRSEGIRYKRPGVFDAVVGLALPPAVIYYGHRELTVGRHYRSLFDASIYKATKNGTAGPIDLEPGGEAKGTLFFRLPSELNPYRPGEGSGGVDSAKAAVLELVLRPSGERSFDLVPGTEGWKDAAVAYIDGRQGVENVESAEAAAGGKQAGGVGREGVLFALPAGGRLRGGGLHAGLKSVMLQRGAPAMSVVSGGLSASARIADAAAAGSRAACAVNFKAGSRVYVVDTSDPPMLLGEIDLDRRIERIFLTEEALIAATNDGRCRYVSLDGMKERRDVKIGRHVRDLFLDGERLLVMEKAELSIYDAAAADPLRLIERRPLAEADRRLVGIHGGLLYILHGSGDAERDTVAVCDRGSFEEIGRTILPAPVRFSCAAGAGVLLQLDGGLVLSVAADGTSRACAVEVVGHLPFEAALVERTERGYTAVGRDGSVATGDIHPELAVDLVTAVPVSVGPAAVTSSRSREGR
ncbi:MAG TPA: hypothetical protein ENO08_00025 [Candidatus Eisenbacteria bacterium]|uniref:Uncharacterized protein n=1 Tax=Eiseniibacteriota bacterium TaxID=2212470 RepID=A0A7V2AT86_UNCEI|nr:hypothetical protein [Candidatus Eisenbacteria bacterium]